MKTLPLLTLSILIIFFFTLAACAGQANTGTMPDSQALMANGTPFPFPQSEEQQLMWGTFALEGTENAITAEQAAQLLPLWKAVRSLSASDTVAEEEINALFEQIQETMTTEQMDAINALELTGEEMAAIAEAQGFEIGGPGGGFSNLSETQRATLEAARASGEGSEDGPSGEFPGGPPAGGGGFPGGPGGGAFQNLSPEQQSTLEAARASGGVEEGRVINTALLEALITFLEGKAQ
ncbi:MAG: hypothetical protein Fur0022_03520 [Anaerolineales bacterium]